MTATSAAALRSPDAFFPAWLAVVRAYNLCDQLLTRRLAPLGLRTAEHELLMNLLRHPGCSQQQLGQQVLSAKSVVSTGVSKLQERGLLRRETDATDARIWCLYLTPAGERLALQALQVQNEVVALMGAQLQPQEIERMAAGTQRINEALAEALAALAP